VKTADQADADLLQNISDPRTDSGSLALKKLRIWTDENPIPSISLARICISAKRQQKAVHMVSLDGVVARHYSANIAVILSSD